MRVPRRELFWPRLPAAARAETFIQKTKKLYVDTRAQRNLKILNDDLQDVHKIMTKNIQDVLHRGEKLDGQLVPVASLPFLSASAPRGESFDT